MKIPFAFLLLCLLCARPVAAQSQATLFDGGVSESGARFAGLLITLEPGWKTYWRAPQGSGIPPELDWTGSENLASARIAWPSPEIFTIGGMTSVGYKQDVVLPIEITPRDPGQPVELNLSLFYGICDEVCLPAQDAMSLALPADGAQPLAAPIRDALARRPLTAAEAGITEHSCAIRPANGRGFDVTTRLRAAGPLGADYAVIESGAKDIWITPRMIEPQADGMTIRSEMAHYGKGSFSLDRSQMRVTLFTGAGTIDLRGCPAS